MWSTGLPRLGSTEGSAPGSWRAVRRDRGRLAVASQDPAVAAVLTAAGNAIVAGGGRGAAAARRPLATVDGAGPHLFAATATLGPIGGSRRSVRWTQRHDDAARARIRARIRWLECVVITEGDPEPLAFERRHRLSELVPGQPAPVDHHVRWTAGTPADSSADPACHVSPGDLPTPVGAFQIPATYLGAHPLVPRRLQHRRVGVVLTEHLQLEAVLGVAAMAVREHFTRLGAD